MMDKIADIFLLVLMLCVAAGAIAAAVLLWRVVLS